MTYAALFCQAVTESDIRRYVEVRASDEMVRNALLRHTGHLWHYDSGLYSLPANRFHIPLTLHSRERAVGFWRSAVWWAKFISLMPFVRMVAVTGSLAMNNLHADDDIDLLLVTRQRRVWLTRLFIVGLTRIAMARGDKLCPNFLLAESALELEDRGYFVARELLQMVPLFGLDVYEQMLVSNRWTRCYLPAAASRPPGPPLIALGRIGARFKGLLEQMLGGRIGDALERWEMARKIARLSALPGAEPPDVILTAEQCKGHFRRTHRARADAFTHENSTPV